MIFVILMMKLSEDEAPIHCQFRCKQIHGVEVINILIHFLAKWAFIISRVFFYKLLLDEIYLVSFNIS